MQTLINQFGIDWKLFIAQIINFGIVLIILKIFVYKPIIDILKERRKKIEEGIIKAKAAEEKLSEVEKIKLQKIKEAELEGLDLIKYSETKAREIENKILEEAKQKQQEILRQTELIINDNIKKSKEEFYSKAKELIYDVIVKAVEINPKLIDEALINKALKKLEVENQKI